LRDVEAYAQWYGGAHKAPELQKEAVYGLSELHRQAIAEARLVANPGCYPTSVQLPLVPLLQKCAISKEGIIIDSKSGVSGAGRAAKEANLFCEVADGMHAYGVGQHRHMPEIEQGLSDAAGAEVVVSFTPHLIPMSRGMQSTMYVQLADGQTADSLREALADFYKDEYFVRYAYWHVTASLSSPFIYGLSSVYTTWAGYGMPSAHHPVKNRQLALDAG
jgi:N-acetyl-gamma-glutamyl-phosphate reductase